jgi:hypothetical protein
MRRVKILPRLASVAAFLCLMFAHLLWPAMVVSLGPVHTMSASANGWHGAPIKALDEAETGRLCEESNAEWRPRAPVPFGLLPKWPCASLQSLAGLPARLRFAPRSWPFRPCNALVDIV